VRLAQSFLPDEVKILAYIFEQLLRNQPPDPRIVRASPAFQQLASKVIRMRQKSVAARLEPATPLEGENSAAADQAP
jgi:hypothetical protein